MSNMAINKQNVHYNLMFILTSLQVFTDCMEHGTEWQKEHTGWSSSTHFPLQSPRKGHHSGYGRLIVSIVTGIKAHLSHMPPFLFKPHIGCQKCDTVMLSYHCPRYTGSYQTPNWAWLAWVHE